MSFEVVQISQHEFSSGWCFGRKAEKLSAPSKNKIDLSHAEATINAGSIYIQKVPPKNTEFPENSPQETLLFGTR